MAYVPEKKDENEQAPVGGGTPPGSFGDTTPNSTPTKSNFVNVMDYLNKNPEGSANIGTAAAGKLNQQRTEAEGALADTQSKFGSAVQGGSTTLDQGLLDRAFSDPSKFTSNPDDLAKFTAMRDASYHGPTSLESTSEYAPTASKISALGETAKSVGTEAGRNSLVEGLSSHPTHGKTALSQLMLQGNDAAAQKVNDAAGSFKGVEDQWQQFMQSAPSQIEQAKTGTNAAKTATNTGLQDNTAAFMKQLQDQTAKAGSERDAFNTKYQNLTNGISNGGSSLNQQQLDDLGIHDAFPYLSKFTEFNQGLSSYGTPVQLSGYQTTPGHAASNVPTMEGTATPEQYAKEAALQKMAGYDLGLPDQPASPYSLDGKLPTLDYMGAFSKAGTDLRGLDASHLEDPTYTNPALNPAVQRWNTPNYYTDVNQNLTAPTAPPVYQDPNATGPAPYPQPTSNPPSNLVHPQWNPYTGQWEGVQLQSH